MWILAVAIYESSRILKSDLLPLATLAKLTSSLLLGLSDDDDVPTSGKSAICEPTY